MMQAHETEFILENGDKVYIRVSFSDWKGTFDIQSVGIKPKGKRNIRYQKYTDDYSYRKLNTKERHEYEMNIWLESASVEMLNEAMLKAWEALKPMPLEIKHEFNIKEDEQ